MSRKSIQLLALLALCALTLLAASCGGDDSSNATETAAATEAKSEESGSSGGSAKDCKEFEAAATQVGQQFATALTGTGGTADLQKAAKLFDELTSRAPDEIKADFETINEAMSKLAEALEGVDLSGQTTPDAATLEKLQKISTEIDQQKLSQASANITAWAQKNCRA